MPGRAAARRRLVPAPPQQHLLSPPPRRSHPKLRSGKSADPKGQRGSRRELSGVDGGGAARAQSPLGQCIAWPGGTPSWPCHPDTTSHTEQRGNNLREQQYTCTAVAPSRLAGLIKPRAPPSMAHCFHCSIPTLSWLSDAGRSDGPVAAVVARPAKPPLFALCIPALDG